MQTMKAPMAGVFYQSPSPDAEPFVSIGQKVDVGDVLSIAGYFVVASASNPRLVRNVAESIEETAKYVVDRKQFDIPISEFQLTQWTLGHMVAQTAGARAITYAAARAFDTACSSCAAGTVACEW